ncbi:MAG: NAD-dependent deacylase [Flavobacterium sp.]|nr:NAD-dependent deacylase [Flavobacterium sp.]
MKKKLLVLTGAGISAESGIQTFRDSDGLWEGHNVNDVATPEGWARNPELVMDFYNKRRAQLHTVLPNLAHEILVDLEKDFDVSIITQNVDNLHEKAGSTNVLHLHGELLKVRSTKNSKHIFDWHNDLTFNDFDDNGHQLRPHIVWFGEEVPELENAVNIVQQADIVIIIGTSLQVYPAASLMNFAQENIPVYYVDLKLAEILDAPLNLKIIAATASKGLQSIQKELMKLK